MLAFLTSLFRKKRDLSAPATKPRTVTLRHDEADAHIEQLFEVLEANDPSDCFKRAICQLEAAKHQRTLSDLEQFFVGLFGQRPHLPDPSRSRLSSFPFQYAAFIGHASRSARTCSETYGRCRLRPGELIEMYAARGQPKLSVQGSSAALSILPASAPLGTATSAPSILGARDSAKKNAVNVAMASPYHGFNKGSSGYDMLKNMLKDVLMGRKSFKRPTSAQDDESRALITIQFSGR
ncbi:uncharacterized protein [Dermacentor albipictus]|uniref:uncharacterized protein n=1 Tax=Dermacentor albipictus TaxID=60249 RepID=UPI0038FC23A5